MSGLHPLDPEAVAWIEPAWPVPPQVGAVMSTRIGGRSDGAFAGMNLRAGIGDDDAAVTSNQATFASRCGATPVWLRQVHGVQVAMLESAAGDMVIEADAALTTRPGLACAVQVADCLPLLLASANGRAVAAVHAGWRGLAGGVIERAVSALTDAAGCKVGEVHAWLGPCIGPATFEVGADVLAGFGLPAVPGEPAPGFEPRDGLPPRWLANLPRLARQRLAACGVQSVHGNDGSVAWCTVSNPSRFFSYRRDGITGRQAAAVWLRG